MRKIYKKYNSLAKGFAYLSTSSVFGIIVGFATVYTFANFVDQSLYGQYQFVLTVISILSLFSVRGIQFAIVEEIIAGIKNAVIRNTKKFIKYALMTSVIAISLSGYYFYKGDTYLGLAIFLVAITFPFFQAFRFYNAIFLAHKDFRRKAMFDSIYSFVPSVIVLIAVLNLTTLPQIIGVYLISNLVVSAVLFFIAKNITYPPLTNYLPFKQNKNFSRSINISILDLEKLIHKLFIFNFLGAVSLATYMIASIPVREMGRIQQIFRSLSLSRIAESNISKIKGKVIEKTIFLTLIFSLVASAYTMLAPEIIRLLFPLYLDSINLTKIAIWVLPFSSMFLMYQSIILHGTEKMLYFINITSFIIRCIALTVGLMVAGLTGVAVAIVVSIAIRFMFVTLSFLKL